MNFKEFLEMIGTSVPYDGTKPKEDWNWWGAVGKTGVSPKKDPIKKWIKKTKLKNGKKQ